ncbi:hypothetical protein K239x_57940 [Planctomycetes bacterium K23_9]|uniref:Uncharacterized protein n=1 Tax=Stieleria marina TaxID=1930275 RepID=A0A517P323_9BACT|nr:hypothetical protein K239x_57940 [Planctomycetes bacterium K23_9]
MLRTGSRDSMTFLAEVRLCPEPHTAVPRSDRRPQQPQKNRGFLCKNIALKASAAVRSVGTRCLTLRLSSASLLSFVGVFAELEDRSAWAAEFANGFRGLVHFVLQVADRCLCFRISGQRLIVLRT